MKGRPPSRQRIEGVQIGRGRPRRWQKLFGALLLVVPMIGAIASGFPTKVPVPPEGGYFLPIPTLAWYKVLSGGLWIAWFVALAAYFLARTMPGPLRSGAVVARQHAITIELDGGATRTIERQDIAHLERSTDHLLLHLRGGEVLRLSSAGNGTIERMTALLTGRHHSQRLSVRSLAANERTGCLFWAMAAAFGISFLVALGHAGDLVEQLRASSLTFSTVGWGALSASLALLTGSALSRRRLTIGADGLRIDGFWRRRFVPFADLEAMAATVRRGPLWSSVRLRLKDGEMLTLPALGEPEALAASIEQARDRWDEASSIPEASSIERRDRSNEDWMAALRSLAQNRSYRHTGLRVEDLEVIVESPRAPPEQRVAAGLALASDREGKKRVRIAASSCAEPDLAAALEAAAEGELAEAPLKRASRRRAS